MIDNYNFASSSKAGLFQDNTLYIRWLVLGHYRLFCADDVISGDNDAQANSVYAGERQRGKREKESMVEGKTEEETCSFHIHTLIPS